MYTKNTNRSLRGFTLVEIMIVVIIIGLLAALAIPTIHNSQRAAKGATFINDVRTYGAAAEVFSLETGDYPDAAGAAVMPAGLEEYIPTTKWTATTPIGGSWNFLKNSNGIVSALGATGYTATVGQLMHIEAKFDDGSLTTGKLQTIAGGYYYIVAH